MRSCTLLTLIADETEEEAPAKHEDYQQYVSYEGSLVLVSGWFGVGPSGNGPDQPLGSVESTAMHSPPVGPLLTCSPPPGGRGRM